MRHPLLLLMTLSASASLAAAQAPGVGTADTVASRRDSLMNAALASIRGREGQPAEQVFKNIKVLTGRPAGAVLRIMNMGFGRSLGVSCEHCHGADYETDDKPAKSVARDMWRMVDRLNGEILPGIQGIRSARPTVNCTTCHRGATKPAVSMP